KCAICGLKQHANPAVASTMSRQNPNTASPSSANFDGNLAGSGSSPTQTREFASLQRARNASMKSIATSCVIFATDYTDEKRIWFVATWQPRWTLGFLILLN